VDLHGLTSWISWVPLLFSGRAKDQRMCGRATLSSPAEDVAEIFDALPIEIGPPRFNVAPTQPVVTVRASSSTSSKASKPHELTMMRWGLIPWWAKADEAKKIASKCIQARAETVQSSAAFRDAFKRHRCLVVFDGFFEWKTLPDGRRIPHHIRKTNHEPFAVAGVWDSWRPRKEQKDEAEDSAHVEGKDVDLGPNKEGITSCAVLTTASVGSIRQLHNRMPLILPANEWSTWLEGSEEDAARLLEFASPRHADHAREMLVIPVSTWVNSVKHDDPKCIEPVPIEDATSSTVANSGVIVNKKGQQIGFSFANVPMHKKKATRAK
jgi:putative SOS response-associated peptidase YedK